MEHKMRRFKQQLSIEETERILAGGTNGVLSLVDIDGAPYGVPVSYAYDGKGHIYLHSAVSGHKIDCINSDSRCSFCVIEMDRIVPEEFTTYFRSAIVTGEIRILSNPQEIHNGLVLLCEKYSPGIDYTDEIAKCINRVNVIRIDIVQMTGKQAIELVRQNGND